MADDEDEDQDQFDLFGSRKARDESLTLVSENSGLWFGKAITTVASLRGWIGTGEDLRILVSEKIGQPHHHNAWGSMVNHSIKMGLLRRTGERRPLRSIKGHARQTDVYVSR